MIQIVATDNYRGNLNSIEAYWDACLFPAGHGILLTELAATALVHLRNHPRMGRNFMQRQSRSVDTVTRAQKLEALLDTLGTDAQRAEIREYVMTDLRERFDQVLAELESVAGWRTARVQRPVLILGSLDGIEIGVRQLIRTTPLETTVLYERGLSLTVPTEAEILRIKGILILKRNATRDYLDFVALADHMGDAAVAQALRDFDRLYSQDNGQSALQQLQVQLAHALPFDLEDTNLSEYKNLLPRWHEWATVQATCAHVAVVIFDRVSDLNADLPQPETKT